MQYSSISWHINSKGAAAICKAVKKACPFGSYASHEDFLEDYQKSLKISGKPGLTRRQHQVQASYYGKGWGTDDGSKTRFRKVAVYDKEEDKLKPSITPDSVVYYNWLYEDPSFEPNSLEKSFSTAEGEIAEGFSKFSTMNPEEWTEEQNEHLYLTIRFLAIQSGRSKGTIEQWTKVYDAIANSVERRYHAPKGMTSKALYFQEFRDNIDETIQNLLKKIKEENWVMGAKTAENEESFIVSDVPCLLFNEEGELLESRSFDLAKSVYIPLSSKNYFFMRAPEAKSLDVEMLNNAQHAQAEKWIISVENLPISKTADVAKVDSTCIRVNHVSILPITGQEINAVFDWHPNLPKVDGKIDSSILKEHEADYRKFAQEDYDNFIYELYGNIS